MGIKGVGPDSLLNAKQAIEDPLIAVVVSFALGLVLYFLDIAYATPVFWRNIPSTHLHEKLDKAGVKTNALSLFFYVSDSLMPPNLQERALLFGAMFRIGFQVVVFTLAAGILLPALLLIRLDDAFAPSVSWSRLDVLTVIFSVTVLVLLPGIRLILKRGARVNIAAISLLVVPWALSVILWLNSAFRFLPTSFSAPNWQLGATILMVAAWTFLRVFGPVHERFQFWSGRRRVHPDEPYPSPTTEILDGLASLNALVGTLLLSGSLTPAQMLTVGGLLAAGLALSLARKHERQLHGIYLNQNYWIDSQFEAILGRIPK